MIYTNLCALPSAMPSSIEERNDYSVRRLQILDQTLAAKVQAIVFLNYVLVYMYCGYLYSMERTPMDGLSTVNL